MPYPRVRTRLEFSKPSRTHQSMRDECDVNFILRKWAKTGLISHVSSKPPKFGSFDNVVDYQSACNQVIAADAAFMALPSRLRERFSNDPHKLLLFINDPINRDEAVRLGLFKAPEPPPPAPEPFPPAT